jgi:hypothetical protein
MADLSGGTTVYTPLTGFAPNGAGPAIIGPPGGGGGPTGSQRAAANLHDAYGHYYMANSDATGIRLRRADGKTPRTDHGLPGWALDTHASSAVGTKNPFLLARPDRTIALFYDDGFNVDLTTSGDRGATWGTPMSLLGGSAPFAARNALTGSELVVAVQSDGSLKGTIQHPGDPAPSAPFILLDSAGATLHTDGTGPAVSPAPDGTFVMAMVASGGSSLSNWWSGDFGKTWTEVT